MQMVTAKTVITFCWTVGLFNILTCVNSQNTYDFIVVGSGAGGGVVTKRLVDAKFNVLLIESGGLPPEGYDVPVRAPQVLVDPRNAFLVPSVPATNAALHFNGVSTLFYGKMLGGTTSMNYMWWNRGHPRDYDNWAEVAQDNSWSYDSMLKYFKRSENYKGDFPSDQHGHGGPITVTRQRYSPGLHFWLQAGREMGYAVGDPNGPQRLGFSPVEFSKKHGRRDGSLTGYIGPILNSPNFDILTNTNVTQVIFRNKRAIGVRISTNSTRFSTSTVDIYATKEVIISAGTYNSPLILQRSGIGPRHVLQAAGIPQIVDLPVGLNYHDQVILNLNYGVRNASVVFNEEQDLTPENWELFKLAGDGPFTNVRGGTGQALLSSSVAKQEGNGDWPDIQLIPSHSTLPWAFVDGLAPSANRLLRPEEVPISMVVYVGRPKSRGSVQINPNDVLGNPLVDVGLLTDSRDEQIMLEGIYESLRAYEQTHAFSPLSPRYLPAELPACDQLGVRSSAYWRCYIRHVALPGCHPCGTNKMGSRNDPSAVVDTELRVIGVDGLRVIDASVMPFVTNANTQAPTYAIAEKGADLILKRWQFKSLPWARDEYNETLGGYPHFPNYLEFKQSAKY